MMPFDDSDDEELRQRATRVGLVLEPGMQVGPFKLDKLLGKGGMGEVWRAIDPSRGDERHPGYVALKFLPLEIQGSARELRRAKETFRAVNALQHPNICPVYSLQEHGRFGHVLEMKYIRAVGLLEYREQFVQREGKFPLSEVVRVLQPIAAALDYAHRPEVVHRDVKPVIHRDIKPENILISEDGREIQLVDFGLAFQIRTSMTRVSQVEVDSSGTRPYMAPEQWRGQDQDARTDQYGLAVVAYELLADRLPFEVSDSYLLRQCVLSDPVPPLHEQSESVNRALSKALSKERNERFADCRSFIAALESSAPASPARADAAEQQAKPKPLAKKQAESPPPQDYDDDDSSLELARSPEPAIKTATPAQLKMPIELTNSIGLKLKLLPAGTFTMGDAKGDDDEKPAHQVTLTRPFYLGIYPVTQEQYERVMGQNPSCFKGPRNPVESVSWEDAVEFCRKLSALPEEKAAGRVYRLPTEAEWEYACRAGSKTQYCFGDDESRLGAFAWYYSNSGEKTHPVGEKQPNAWGLYDMYGNVWEWCADWHDAYPDGAVSDPLGPQQGSSRVPRGGSWLDGAAHCRSAFRGRSLPSGRGNDVGFRVALSSPGIPK
jgi:formylglycine-generating enzyme required for sulfatase activity